jgi:dimethylargininase
MLIAITRKVSPNISLCELSHLERHPIDYENAARQHHEYEQSLVKVGCKLTSLPAERDLPDSVFVEDAAVVFDELAMITRPGADSRKPEVDSIALALEPFRKLFYIHEPGTMDGGDVLKVGRQVFVGITLRSNPEGIEQMANILAPYGYSVRGVPVHGCLHLKSAVTQVGEKTLLINPAWVDRHEFPGMDFIEVDPAEPFGGNALLIEEKLIYPSAYEKTRQRLEDRGIRVQTVDASELAKAEGGVTCCSLIFKEVGRNG